jgi:hypothetical protein
VIWDTAFGGVKLGLAVGRTFLMAEGGRAFFVARRRGDVEKNWVRWKLLEEKRWSIRGLKAHWCRKRHPLEKADICDSSQLVTHPIGLLNIVQSLP